MKKNLVIKIIKNQTLNKKHYEHCWKLAKRKLKNTIRKAHQQRLQAQVQQIESLRSKDPRQYWRGLYDLEGPITVGEKIPLQIKNSLNVVVKGDEACKAWMDSFSKLGREASDFNDFDTTFYVHIRDKVSSFLDQSLTNNGNCILDNPFTLEEVTDAISKLKESKAVGIDGIMNETFKYGGEQVATHLFVSRRL